MSGRLSEGEYLPSIRGLAKDLRISVITTMKAYEQLAVGTGIDSSGKGLYRKPTGQECDKGEMTIG